MRRSREAVGRAEEELEPSRDYDLKLQIVQESVPVGNIFGSIDRGEPAPF